MKTSKLHIVFGAILVALLAVGCGPKQDRKTNVRVRGASGNLTPTNNPTGGTGQPGQPYKAQYGDVTGYSEDGVKALLSASMDTEKDMQLPLYGISLAGDIKVNNVRNVLSLGSSSGTIASNSQFALYIIDDLTYSQHADAITIGFNPGTNGARVSGQISNGGQVSITFTDDYGDIYIQGSYNSYQFTGTIGFKNSKGTAAGQSMTLGQFRVPTCGFFHCE